MTYNLDGDILQSIKDEEVKSKRGVKKGSKRGKYRSRNRRIGGERPNYKLTREEVVQIWELLQKGEMTQWRIAELFYVSQECISHIATGTRWNVVTRLPRRKKSSTDPAPTGSRQGRPRTSYLKTLKKPTKKNYNALQDACIVAILSGLDRIKIKLPTRFKRPEGFPNLIGREVLGKSATHYVHAKPLLNWLYNNGHSKYNSKDIEKVNSQVNSQIKLADMTDTKLDLFKDFTDNDFLED